MALFPLRYFINIRVRSRFEIQLGHSNKKCYTIEIHINFFTLLLMTNLKFKYWTDSNQYGLTVEEFTISCLDFLAGGGVVLPWCSDKTNSSSKIQVNNFQKVSFLFAILSKDLMEFYMTLPHWFKLIFSGLKCIPSWCLKCF